ncbi:baseplate J/gp47 family protein [Candidatus Symbiopectobacterium sp. NZEC135]|uniref:baseplate J/gp47 family protein n=1 Tax=Candidatus Symbiopectobacterium sp. NZEC135 TaxID=2820471 RepID=UPI00222788B7|nr:baseplate J/gp47 family protein [Candidatus Symbiopectobacterium sp. NZEC135]MCW2480477.1 baseplate J/gp47 family protein [Candidatus Symbiopectobacterium sp. NZEC135]
MPHITPSFEETRTRILRDIRNLLPTADIDKDSDYYVRASSVASVVTGVYQHQGWIVRQIFPDTADTEFLEMHCRLRDISRKAATTATGSITATGNVGAPAAAGLVITVGSLSYTTTAAGTVGANGSVVIPAIASASGAAGNTTAAAVGTFASAPFGFDSTVTISVMAGGTDRETDAEMLSRLLELIRRPPAGGNKYDYKRWALSVTGVTSAYVYPLRRGMGTVDVVITSADGLPSADIISAVQAYIDDVRPVTAKNTIVLGPTIKTIDITVGVLLNGVSLADATAAIITALTDYIKTLAPGDPFIRSQAEMMISQVAGVIDRNITLPAGNVYPVTNENKVEWIRAGNITVVPL